MDNHGNSFNPHQARKASLGRGLDYKVKTKLDEALRQLEITYKTDRFPHALRVALMEMANVIVRPKTVFKKFYKPKNQDAMRRNTHRIEKFHDPYRQ
jgi:hypothetical protein